MRNNHTVLSIGDYQEVNSSAPAVYSFLRLGENITEKVLLIHNTGTERETFPISLTASELTEGTYNLRDLTTDVVIGSISVASNGGFDGTNEAIPLAAFTSYALSFESQ